MFERHPANPLITPGSVRPSRPDFEIIGTFNAGAAIFHDEVVLLVRVAERPIHPHDGQVLSPQFTPEGELQVITIERDDPNYDTSDPRLVIDKRKDATLLTSVSHFRLARSADGALFTVEDQPWLSPLGIYECYGVEDARITNIGDVYYVNYSTVGPLGIGTGLVKTTDFKDIERLGVIFPPSNRDVTLFPEKIGGQYVCYHRPMPSGFGSLHMWSATSPDLVRWGDHRVLLQASDDGWEGGRIGGGAPPLKTEQGWLSIYHAADRDNRYCLGAFLTPLDDPFTITARSRQPILAPEAPYEKEGFFSEVVFTCGAVIQEKRVLLYYGASDESIAMAEMAVDELLEMIL